MHIGFLTYLDHNHISEDDEQAAALLRHHGFLVEAVAWDDPNYEWQQLDAIIVRSCWNYHLQPEKFIQWLAVIGSMNIPVFNPIETLSWNMHKSYLQDFKARGVNTLETQYIEKGSSVADFTWPWQEVVVKPMISAGADNTHRLSAEEQAHFDLQAYVNSHDTMVQKFSSQLVSHGELSFIFFNRVLSHVVKKTPDPSDFRTQMPFNPRYQLYAASADEIAQVEKVLNILPDEMLYARIDGIFTEGVFHLIEIELLEPWLFLQQCASASHAFAEAIKERVHQRLELCP